jgi:hypothetical protein
MISMSPCGSSGGGVSRLISEGFQHTHFSIFSDRTGTEKLNPYPLNWKGTERRVPEVPLPTNNDEKPAKRKR